MTPINNTTDDIILNGISKRYGERIVFDSFTFRFASGGRYYLSGASGSGKTTLFNIICGIEKPDSGELWMKQGMRLSYVFQDDRLIPFISAVENVSAVCEGERCSALRILDEVGLAEDADKLPDELSGGMQKRVGLARALEYDGDVFLLDEPFSGIDVETKRKCAEVILSHAAGRTIILSSHDIADAGLLFPDGFETVEVKKLGD